MASGTDAAMRRDDRLKIIVGSVFVTSPFSPGIAWDWLHLIFGLQALGHEVLFVEEVPSHMSRDADGRPCPPEHSVNRRHFRAAMERFGLLDRACQLHEGTAFTEGLSRDALHAAVRGTDLLINVSGHVKSDFILEAADRRVYFDQDPVFTQLWLSEYGVELNLRPEDTLLTVGLNIGTPHTEIPDCGLRWHHCLPAVALEHWPVAAGSNGRPFTTVASFGSYSELQFRGEWYRSKREAFRDMAELAKRTDQQLEVALKAPPDDADAVLLREQGWRLVDPGRIDSLASYQNYIAASSAEIGIAKDAYVRSNSGWFSDRAAHYLASGKPVLAQSTGFERCLPTGRGLLTFRDVDEAAAGIAEINGDYAGHCRAARELAEEFLDARKVMAPVVELAMA
ncbi:MAG: hypothetical protein H0V50_03980 [Thermoleophilaceae bacterium]|nr:hypothetical protein [Thermoleophilaceae bacterium]